MRLFVCFLTFVLTFVAAAFAQTATAPATRDWPALTARLASADVDTRDAAQHELETISFAEFDQLQRLIPQTEDLEARTRFEKRLADMRADRVLRPPLFTLNLDFASLDDVAKAMNAFADHPVFSAAFAAGKKPTFTLKLRDAPLGQVLASLNEQHPIVAYSGEHMTLDFKRPAQPPTFRVIDKFDFQSVGPFLVRTTPRQVILPDHHGVVTVIEAIVVVDPRLHVLCYQPELDVRQAFDSSHRAISPIKSINPSDMQAISASADMNLTFALDTSAADITQLSGVLYLEIEVDGRITEVGVPLDLRDISKPAPAK